MQWRGGALWAWAWQAFAYNLARKICVNNMAAGDDERKFALETTFHFILLTGMLKAKKKEVMRRGRSRRGRGWRLLKSSLKVRREVKAKARDTRTVCADLA